MKENGEDGSSHSMHFEEFPAEIFHQIFDYLSGDQVIHSFFGLNLRFNQLVENCQLRTIDLSTWRYREMTDLIKRNASIISQIGRSFRFGNHLDPIHRRCTATSEFILSLLIEPHDLQHNYLSLEQIILMRPIIDRDLCLTDEFLRSFFIHSTKEKLVLKKSLRSDRIENLFISNLQTLRTFLDDQGGFYNRIFVYERNPEIATIISRVRHLTIFLENFRQQWSCLSPYVTPRLEQFTLIILDPQFQSYLPAHFAALFKDSLHDNCRFHFFLRIHREDMIDLTNVDMMLEEYRTEFYRQHQCEIVITYARPMLFNNRNDLLIYTTPVCVSHLILSENQQLIGAEPDYRNITRLTLDPCVPVYPVLNPITGLIQQHFPRLTSLEYSFASLQHFNDRTLLWNHAHRQIRSQIRHLHLNRCNFSGYSLRDLLSYSPWTQLQSLEITTDLISCFPFQYSTMPSHVRHLTIRGAYRLDIEDIKSIGISFLSLETLKFKMILTSSYTTQLDTIAENFLINMGRHLRYLHVSFEQNTLLIMSTAPSEHQLGEWLGHNQRRLAHLQVIELTRKEFLVWL